MNRRDILKFFGYSAAASAISEPLPHSLIAETPVLADTAGSSTLRRAAFNQVGFLPGGEKVATVPAQDGADGSFQIVPEIGAGHPSASASGHGSQPVFHGTIGAPVLDAASGDRVALADFSAWTTPGAYRLQAQGRRGEPFSIGADVYRDAV